MAMPLIQGGVIEIESVYSTATVQQGGHITNTSINLSIFFFLFGTPNLTAWAITLRKSPLKSTNNKIKEGLHDF